MRYIVQWIVGSCGHLLCSLCVGLVLKRSFVLLGKCTSSIPQLLGQRNVQEKGENTSDSSCIPPLGPRSQLLLKP